MKKMSHKIPKEDPLFCILCARDEGLMVEATCMVYSLDYARKIAVCCLCCHRHLQQMNLKLPFAVHLN